MSFSESLVNRRRQRRFRPQIEALESRLAPALLTVNTLADGLVNLNDAAVTLRDAIHAANTDVAVSPGGPTGSGADEIRFQAGVSGTVLLNQGPLAIRSDLTISGPGANFLTVSGNSLSNVFEVSDFTDSAKTVTISGLTISSGRAPFGGGLRNQESLTIDSCTISGNSAVDGRGGGIFNGIGGTLTVRRSTIRGNSSSGSGGGIANFGTLSVQNSSVSGNTAGRDGGGIFNQPSEFDDTLIVRNSTISGNSAGDDGGAIANFGALTVQNSTISGNAATIRGGGIFNANRFFTVGELTLQNATVTNNHALAGGGLFAESGVVLLHNTIVADNVRGSGGATEDDIGLGLLAGVVSGFSSNNLIGTGGSGGLTHGTNGNLVGIVDPKLGPLADNGGPTPTHALLPRITVFNPGSPALDAGNNAQAPGSNDQRGTHFARIAGTAVDIGAYELQTLNLVVDTNVDEDDADLGPGDLSLREALRLSNGNPRADSITFSSFFNNPVLPRVITLSLGQLPIRDSVTIAGFGQGGVRVNANGASRVFDVADFRSTVSTVTISGLTISGGSAPTSSGGGILNRENLILVNSTVSGNSAGNFGGGIFNSGLFFGHSASLTVRNGTISGNSAANGGGIHNAGSQDPSNRGVLTVETTTISGNRANDNGGGIDNQGVLTVRNSTFSGNSAGETGGAISAGSPVTVLNSTVTLHNSTITENFGGGTCQFPCIPTSVGGAILVSSRVTLHNTIVADNFRGGTNSEENIKGGAVDASSTNNLIGTGASGGLTNGTNGNQVGVANPLLGPRTNNGGPTQTHALLAGSPALNAGNNAQAAGSFDQRGVPRLAGGRVDIGAVEQVAFLAAGNLVVSGSAGNDVILVRPGIDPSLVEVLYDGIFAGSFSLAAITGKITADAREGNDTVTIAAAISKPAELIGGPGNDSLTGGSGNDRLTGGPGRDVLDGGDGNDALFSNDGAGGDTVRGGNGDDTASADAGDLVDLGAGEDGLVFHGTAGHDNIRVSRQVGPGGAEIVFLLNGQTAVIPYLNGETVFVFAGKGHDRVIMDDSAAFRWTAEFHGEEGHDHLVGSLLNDRLEGGPGNDRLEGGPGNDILLGGKGDDLLRGGSGRDLLIGGLGADRLVGGGDDDLLIAGYTAFDANAAALRAILAEWTSERDYQTRVANLSGSGSGPRRNGHVFLKVAGPQASVFDDGDKDKLTGSAGKDWFFANLAGDGVKDKITDLHSGEFADDLDFIGQP